MAGVVGSNPTRPKYLLHLHNDSTQSIGLHIALRGRNTPFLVGCDNTTSDFVRLDTLTDFQQYVRLLIRILAVLCPDQSTARGFTGSSDHLS